MIDGRRICVLALSLASLLSASLAARAESRLVVRERNAPPRAVVAPRVIVAPNVVVAPNAVVVQSAGIDPCLTIGMIESAFSSCRPRRALRVKPGSYMKDYPFGLLREDYKPYGMTGVRDKDYFDVIERNWGESRGTSERRTKGFITEKLVEPYTGL